MKVLIDACVLYPTVLRRLVLGAAEVGAFTPLWSPRILEEWARAAAREGYETEARAEVAAVIALFPNASVTPEERPELSLPDPDDVHVLAAAIEGNANEILTLNLKDFPTNILASHGLLRRHPDEFLLEAWHSDPSFDKVVRRVHARAVSDGIDLSLRQLMKRSRLPRLGKALEQAT